MQNLIDAHTKLHEATGGKTQQTKIFFYCWQWNYESGEKITEEIEAELIAGREKIKQMKLIENVRTLGVCMNLLLSQKNQFKVMRRKLITLITKLMSTDIKSCKVAVYYNGDVIKSTHFRCRVAQSRTC